MTPLAAHLAATNELANGLSAAFTGYLAARTVYIWYKYLRYASGPGQPGTLVGSLKALLQKNPPPAFPTADLPIVTILLGLSSAASVIVYFWRLLTHSF